MNPTPPAMSEQPTPIDPRVAPQPAPVETPTVRSPSEWQPRPNKAGYWWKCRQFVGSGEWYVDIRKIPEHELWAYSDLPSKDDAPQFWQFIEQPQPPTITK